MQFVIENITQINKIIEALTPLMQTNNHFLFDAQMGAGKTTIIKKICKSLGVTENISSPTYSIVNEYEAEGGKLIYHFDLYRLNHEEELLDIGIDEILESNAICFFEWPEKILNFLPHNYVKITITVVEEKRVITIQQIT